MTEEVGWRGTAEEYDGLRACKRMRPESTMGQLLDVIALGAGSAIIGREKVSGMALVGTWYGSSKNTGA